MGKAQTVTPWQQMEAQALHAYREWPLWLVLRNRELAQQSVTRAPAPAPTGGATTQPRRD